MTSTIFPSLDSFNLPTQDDLPYDDDIPMESQRHKTQMELLIETFDVWLETQEQGYANGNMFVYFSLEQLTNQDFRGPDFFAVVDVPKKERKSWVVWEEGKAPDVVIELLSESTKREAETAKREAETARQKEQEMRAQLRQTARNLLEQGMTITQVAQIIGVSEEQLQEW